MKKGFTLIELLAVIIILAVVALIATPIVLDVVEDAKKSAAKSQTGLILDSAKLYYTEQYFKTEDSFEGYECSIANKIGCNELSLEGDKPDQAILTISEKGKVNGKVVVGKYTYYICDNKISETDNCGIIDYTEIYEITEDGTIISIKDSEYVKDGEVTIPEFVGEVEVSKITSDTFKNLEIAKVTILANKAITIEENALPETVTTLVVKSCYADSYSKYSDILEVIETECEVEEPEKGKIICKRANLDTLHTENCTQTSSSYYCSAAGHKGATIKYGNETTIEKKLNSGDAFDCDVNGDGTFSPTTERFYYVSDLYDTTTDEFNSAYAVLIYYNNTTEGVADNTSNSLTKYAPSSGTNGPTTAKNNLPTILQWSNVSLLSTSRTIVTEKGVIKTTYNYTKTVDGETVPLAARLLTHQEFVKACDSTEVSDICNYLVENTKYSKDSLGTFGHWLETPRDSYSNQVWSVHGGHLELYNITTNQSTTYVGARPVIEVAKTNIEY